jgi:hypothetical protein
MITMALLSSRGSYIESNQELYGEMFGVGLMIPLSFIQ